MRKSLRLVLAVAAAMLAGAPLSAQWILVPMDRARTLPERAGKA